VYNVPEISQNAEAFGSDGTGTGNLNLTRENIVGIFNGTIKYWNDSQLTENNSGLVGVSQPIIVTVRMDKGSTTDIFTRALSQFSEEWKATFGSFSDGMY
jgi:phosphate transport system substrate-binding protein